MGGPAPGTGCAVCTHADAAIINALLMSPAAPSSREIARRFRIGKDSVARHAFKRHPGYTPPDTSLPAPPASGEGGGEPETEVSRLKSQRQILETELARTGKADTSRELRQVNGRIAELEGTDRPASVTVADVRGLPEQVARWFAALEPFPDAREAMLAATDPALLEASDVA